MLLLCLLLCLLFAKIDADMLLVFLACHCFCLLLLLGMASELLFLMDVLKKGKTTVLFVEVSSHSKTSPVMIEKRINRGGEYHDQTPLYTYCWSWPNNYLRYLFRATCSKIKTTAPFEDSETTIGFRFISWFIFSSMIFFYYSIYATELPSISLNV